MPTEARVGVAPVASSSRTLADTGLIAIGELSAQTGVPAATLRSWEHRFGFPSPDRSVGGQRRYRDSDVALVRQIQRDRDTGLGLSAAIAVAQRTETVGADSLYAQVRGAHPHLDVMNLSDRVMRALTWAIEDECLAHAARPLLLGCFQDVASFERSGNRWRELARRSRRAVVLSNFPTSSREYATERVALPADSPMLSEWSLLCLDAQLSVALIAWERPALRGGRSRRFEALLSLDPLLVRDAARRSLSVAEAHGLGREDSLHEPVMRTVSEDPRRTASLLRRFATYSDR